MKKNLISVSNILIVMTFLGVFNKVNYELDNEYGGTDFELD